MDAVNRLAADEVLPRRYFDDPVSGEWSDHRDGAPVCATHRRNHHAAGITALRERLAREQRRDEAIESLVEEIMDIGPHCASLSLLDSRSADEIIGYDEHGLPF
jgi:antitoxin VapB